MDWEILLLGAISMVKAERSWTRPSIMLVLASHLLHVIANGHYGFFRDELYFIVRGDRPA
jgi:hypothetical protein